MGNLRTGKAAAKDEFTREKLKVGSELVIDWISKLCNMASERGAVPEDWRSFPLFYCTRAKERELNERTIEVLIY